MYTSTGVFSHRVGVIEISVCALLQAQLLLKCNRCCHVLHVIDLFLIICEKKVKSTYFEWLLVSNTLIHPHVFVVFLVIL